MSRTLPAALACISCLATPVLADSPTQGEQRSVAMILDLCAALVGVDPAGMDATAATIHGLRLTKPLPLEMFPPANRDLIAKLMNLPADENLRLANFETHAPQEGYFSAIRPDARGCFTIATGVPGAAKLLADRLNSANSGWKATDEKGVWVGESRDNTPLAVVVRTEEKSLVVAVLAKGARLDAAATALADKRALAMTEFCGRALLEGAAAMPAIVRDFPGMTLSAPRPLSASDLKRSENIAKSLGVSADTPVHIAGFGDANSQAVIRSDAATCEIMADGTADASALFAGRFGAADSGWTPVKVKSAYQSAWKRPGPDGSLISLIMHSQADVTLIRVFTFRPRSQSAADRLSTSIVLVEKCVAAIRAWQPADPADFAPAFKLARTTKSRMMILDSASDAGVTLALRFDKKKGPDCLVTAMTAPTDAKKIFNAIVEAFLLQPGSSEGEAPSRSAGEPQFNVWRVAAADGRTAVLSGSTDGQMLVMHIHPEGAK